MRCKLMAGTLDNLRDALLLTLVVLLVYVLYKRLLRVLGKDSPNIPRFEIIAGSEQLNDNRFVCRISVPEVTEIAASIYSLNGNTEPLTSFSRSFNAGEHGLDFALDGAVQDDQLLLELASSNHKIVKRIAVN